MNVRLTREDREKIDIIKAILEKEFKNHYTHQQLAQKVSINESKLQLGFKFVHQKTLYEYLRWVRIQKAKELLSTTDLPIKLIAGKVGYDVSNFNKRFKEVTGITPFSWRKNTNDALPNPNDQ
jgi:AraC-like DNA-binding protein